MEKGCHLVGEINDWHAVASWCCFIALNCCALLPVCSAWLTGYDHPDIDKINQRIEDLTGLEMDTAEELQVSCWLGSRLPLAQILVVVHQCN